MNRIQRIAAAAAVSAAVIAPITAAPAFAEPYPWHNPNGLARTKAAIEHEELLRLREPAAPGEVMSSSDTAGFPWETVGLVALGVGAAAAGGAAVVRRSHRVPRHA